MRVLIVYATKYGSVEKCAKLLAEMLDDKIELINLKDNKEVDISLYNKIIIGGSIYAGRIQKEVKDFCDLNLSELQNKKIGLFICGMQEGENALNQLNTVYPQELLNKAVVKEAFGGEYQLKKMNFMEKFIVRQVAKVDTSKDVSNISENKIAKFAQQMNILK